MTNQDVCQAIDQPLYWAVYQAVGMAKYLAMPGAVYDAVYRAVSWVVDGAVSRREDPPHATVELYLRAVAR
jgi:hypothetical protein